jgi:hypothetical protein
MLFPKLIINDKIINNIKNHFFSLFYHCFYMIGANSIHSGNLRHLLNKHIKSLFFRQYDPKR